MDDRTYQVGDDLVIELHPDTTLALTLASRTTGAKVSITLSEVQALADTLLDAAQELARMVATYESVFIRQAFEPEMVLIPAGKFLIGSNPLKDRDAQPPEQPQHALYLPAYFMAKTAVTNAQYAAFVQASGHNPPDHWQGRSPPTGKEDHPVVFVSWYDAVIYCRWLSKAAGENYRLPSEAEWEKGARGSDGRIYPWGDQWDRERCNTREGVIKNTTAVGTYLQGASPYGLLDMAGNVSEFTISLWGEYEKGSEFQYPYDPTNGREDLKADAKVQRVVRGGSFANSRRKARCASRYWRYPTFRNYCSGFRVLLVPPAPATVRKE